MLLLTWRVAGVIRASEEHVFPKAVSGCQANGQQQNGILQPDTTRWRTLPPWMNLEAISREQPGENSAEPIPLPHPCVTLSKKPHHNRLLNYWSADLNWYWYYFKPLNSRKLVASQWVNLLCNSRKLIQQLPSYLECEWQLSVANRVKLNVMMYKISFHHQIQNKYSLLPFHFTISMISFINMLVIQPTLVIFDLCKQRWSKKFCIAQTHQ